MLLNRQKCGTAVCDPKYQACHLELTSCNRCAGTQSSTSGAAAAAGDAVTITHTKSDVAEQILTGARANGVRTAADLATTSNVEDQDGTASMVSGREWGVCGVAASLASTTLLASRLRLPDRALA